MGRTGLAAIVCGIVLGAGVLPARAAGDWNNGKSYLPERVEVNETYKLEPGADVRVRNIAGPVDITTWDGDTAEVHVVNSARSKADLDLKKVVVEHTGSTLSIYTTPTNDRGWNNIQVRQSVTLKLPRRVDVTINDIAGRVDVGPIEGTATVNDVAGSVSIDLASWSPRVNDIAGALRLKVGEIGADGLTINDIAGPVDLTLASETNADLSIFDIAGHIGVEIPNVTVMGKIDSESFKGKIGGGGPTITVHDIAGRVTIRN